MESQTTNSNGLSRSLLKPAVKRPPVRAAGRKKAQTRRKIVSKKKTKKESRYFYYEYSVQTPGEHAEFFEKAYKELTGGELRFIREDFCGTFYFSTEWVKRNPENHVVCLDLDPEPLAYGKKTHWSKLSREEKKRIQVLKKNVMSVTKPSAQMIIACNFSFNIFKNFEDLVTYFKFARKSLRKNGLILLEMVGGPGFIEAEKEHRRYTKNREHFFTYVWHQKSYDPISCEGQYAIHFKFPDGTIMENAFEYDWRVWSIPEIRLAMKAAGFKETYVYWEQDEDDDEVEEYELQETAEHHHSWGAYLVGKNA